MNLYDLWILKTGRAELTPHQQRRKALMTSSNAAILLGCHPWPFRTGTNMEENEVVQLGRLLERPVLRWAARKLGQRIVRNQFRVCKTDRLFAAQHDALSLTDPVGFEAKTSGLRGRTGYTEEWGEPGTDQVPYHILAQCQWQALVSELEVVWVPALIGGRGQILFKVERNEELIKILVERAHDFWDKHVLKDTPPEGDPPSLDLVKLTRRTRGKSITIPGWKAAVKWRKLDAKAKEAVTAAEKAKARVLADMGDAEEAETEAGRVKLTKVSSIRIDTKLLRSEHPEIAAECEKQVNQVRVTWKEYEL